MKGYYLYVEESDFRTESRPLSGVEKKVLTQIDAFNRAGLNAEFIFAMHKIGGLWSKISSRLPFGSEHVDWPEASELKDADWIYIRKPFLMTWNFRRFLKSLRKTVPNVKILLEIPTYPYDIELKNNGWMYYPWLWRERFNRVRLKGLVDRIVLVARPEEQLWGIPTLLTGNGIDPNAIPLRTPQNADEIVRVLCAANFTRAHGIDRFIEGMRRYYTDGGKREIRLELAGDGPEYQHLVALAKQSKWTENRVTFYGHVGNDVLSSLRDQCDLAIAHLGTFRFDQKISSALKTREYMAAGLPMLSEIPIDVLPQTESIVLRIPADETPVSMEDVLSFYDRLYPTHTLAEKQETAYTIRQKMIDRISIDNTMKNVFQYLADKPSGHSS